PGGKYSPPRRSRRTWTSSGGLGKEGPKNRTRKTVPEPPRPTYTAPAGGGLTTGIGSLSLLAAGGVYVGRRGPRTVFPVRFSRYGFHRGPIAARAPRGGQDDQQGTARGLVGTPRPAGALAA